MTQTHCHKSLNLSNIASRVSSTGSGVGWVAAWRPSDNGRYGMPCNAYHSDMGLYGMSFDVYHVDHQGDDSECLLWLEDSSRSAADATISTGTCTPRQSEFILGHVRSQSLQRAMCVPSPRRHTTVPVLRRRRARRAQR
jgi:hypothetical protein